MQKGSYFETHVGQALAITSYCWLLLSEHCAEQICEAIQKREHRLLQGSGVINPENKIWLREREMLHHPSEKQKEGRD